MDALKKAELAQRKVQQANASTSASASTSNSVSPSASSSVASPADTAASGLSPGSGIQSALAASASIKANAANQGERLPSPDLPGFIGEDATTLKPSPSQSQPSPQPAGTLLSLEEIDRPAASVLRTAELVQEAESAQQRETIQNLFETKQAGPSRKTFAIVVGATTILALLAIGLYFWIELQPKSGLQPVAASKAFPQPTMPAQSVTAGITPRDSGAIDSGAIESDTAESTPSQAERQAATKREAFAANNREALVPPVKKVFQVTAAAALSNATLDRAYDALTRGDDAGAKAAYEKVLVIDPKNIDALSGLAVIAQRSGNPARATDYYLQILDADPKNPVALGGLINLQSRMDPLEAETRVKQALSAQPDSPALNFSLGNIYARSKRWGDAQQFYFKATTGDPSNPDYLFNLAVSLEQLRQPKLAATYYAQAIAAAETRPGSFDKTKASERLQQLQQ
jgi:Tfp pilus assembly protein PilF